jgi:hypothetical protein
MPLAAKSRLLFQPFGLTRGLKAGLHRTKPEWLNEKTYREKVLLCLSRVTVPTIVSALAVSEPYATNIRAGPCIPHPRHWLALAQLIGFSGNSNPHVGKGQ